ncbi:hypothetical protein SCORR_v1c02470 [Spiroplasma corruscae]|uniref:Uncharacterized protein n=1 Tax=Spiroplasma corruscae TaxID=216934 RepID=A0A222ENK8_9MOLU|nr:hypothetical protein [Spiroplasma corruscae]ASP28021.1 hypothetical protein SCORR_v1c02470 [Spiroplasma corruscae]
MEENEILKQKILALEKKLEIYHKKEEYLNKGIDKVQGIYEVTRQNAEKIIYKSIGIAHALKDDMAITLKKIQADPNNIHEYVNELLYKNSHLFNDDNEVIKKNISEIVIKIINSN